MILVLLGTQKHNFDRLLKMVERLAQENTILEDIIVQVGSTKYEPAIKNMYMYEYLEDYEEKIEEANLVITHGGIGCITDSLYCDKLVIAVPRLSKYKEHVNDHQKEICNKLSKEGFIFTTDEYKELNKIYNDIKDNKVHVKPFIRNTDNFNEKLNKLLR